MCFGEKLERFTILHSVGEALAEVMTEQEPEGGRGRSHKILGGTTRQTERPTCKKKKKRPTCLARAKAVGRVRPEAANR